MTKIIVLLIAFLSNVTLAASFECSKANRELDKTICLNKDLNQLDEDMASYYFKLKETLDSNEAEQLLRQQRTWLKQRSVECGAKNSRCLVALYKARIFALRKLYENLVPYTYSKNYEFQGIKGACGFDAEVITKNTQLYAGGAKGGKEIYPNIDQSGRRTTQFEVIVNSPDKPVALILGAYEPSIWNFAWTQGTKISAVVVTGYHRQAVAGLPKDTPLLISTHDNGGPCGFTYVADKNLTRITEISRNAFKREVTSVLHASLGSLVFGDQIDMGDKLFTSKDTPPEIFFDKSLPGKAGLDDLVRRGLIRKLTHQDTERWIRLKTDLSEIGRGRPSRSPEIPSLMFEPEYIYNGYVILEKITIPAKLYGADAATFFLQKGVPYPKGELGHSTLYDFNTMSCTGVNCAESRRRMRGTVGNVTSRSSIRP